MQNRATQQPQLPGAVGEASPGKKSQNSTPVSVSRLRPRNARRRSGSIDANEVHKKKRRSLLFCCFQPASASSEDLLDAAQLASGQKEEVRCCGFFVKYRKKQSYNDIYGPKTPRVGGQ